MMDAEIDGLILWHGVAQAVRVERSLLMLDAVRWARWIATKKREEAARWEREGSIRSLAEANCQVREIERWLATGRGTCRSTYVLHRRILFASSVVTPENCDVYVERLLRLRADPATAPSPEFLLDVDTEPPILYVTDYMSAAARHTGPYVRGRVVVRREMMRLVFDALRVSIRHQEAALQQQEQPR